MFPRPIDQSKDADRDEDSKAREEHGSAVRGLIFAMIFNLFLLLIAAAGWELWRIIR
jgi:hypothetical protein